nr:hypothetical protein [Tanacetum cinerariifolium]
MSALSFYRMETDEISKWYIALCFVNGLEAFDGEVNLAFDDNLISNEFVVKLCLDYERELSLFVCKMGKSGRNKKRAMENLNLFYQDVRPSSSAGIHLTQEEAAKEALAIKTAKDKVELDGKTVKEDEEAVKRIKGEALKEKDDPGAFIFSIRLEEKVNENALADTGSGINTMPYRIFETDDNFSATDYWLNISREENLSLSRSYTSTIKRLILRVIHKMITYGLCQRTTRYYKVQKNDLWLLSMLDARHQNGYANVAWVIANG